MIKFFCDLCEADISERVYDSVRQFCGKDHFERNILTGVVQDDGRQLPDVEHEINHLLEPVHLEVKLLNELSKAIHASAWGWSTTTMRCDHCSTESEEIGRKKVITIFTRIPEKRMVPEAPMAALT